MRPKLTLLFCIVLFLVPTSKNPAEARNWNVKKLAIEDLTSLEQRRVPHLFPQTRGSIAQSCTTSSGNKWTNYFSASWDDGFFWAAEVRDKVRIYEGERQNRNIFVIRVKEFAKNGKNNLDWITYRIRSSNLDEALKSGTIEGEYTSGSYWRRCTLRGSAITQASAFSTELAQLNWITGERSQLGAMQEMALVKGSEYGYTFSYAYNFDTDLSDLTNRIAQLSSEEDSKSKVAKAPSVKRTEVNPYARVDAIAALSSEQLCKVVVSSPATLRHHDELSKRGISWTECVSMFPSNRNSLVTSKGDESNDQSENADPVEDTAIASNERSTIDQPSNQVSSVSQAALDKERLEFERLQRERVALENEFARLEAEIREQKSEEQVRIAEIEAARSKAREQIAAARAAENNQLAMIKADKSPPSIIIETTLSKGPIGYISGKVTDDVGVDTVLADGIEVRLESDGSFTFESYIPREGKTVEILAFDDLGKQSTVSVELSRVASINPARSRFAALNPAMRPVIPNRKSAALIIGIADYERTPAKAAFADKDAQYFYDYATMKLGVPEDNILELINEKADRIEMKLAVKNWLRTIAASNESDIYIFFAGHGMASDDGNNMYLLPYDGTPFLLEESAIRRDQLFADIAAMDPNSVTVFLDTCYSGATRTDDMLIAARPLLIRAREQLVPDGFTVISAAAGDQTAKPLEEMGQGLFSYFLMQGMEGGADSNGDGKITAGELHQFTRSKVARYSAGTQTPELQGNENQVLVRFQ